MIIILLILFFFLCFLLIKAADLIVIGVRGLSHAAYAKAFAISAVLLALATSFPELSVGLTSSLGGTPNLSLGNVLGANITNLSLVAGLAAFYAGRVSVHGAFLKRDVAIALAAGILPIILVVDREVSRLDGLILLGAYLLYATSLFRIRFLEVGGHLLDKGVVLRFLREVEHVHLNGKRHFGRVVLGVIVLLLSANFIVKIAVSLAETAGIPVFLVGLILLSVGTTLPELAFSIESLRDKEPTLFFGNLLGSIIANSTLVVGVAATIHPIAIVAFDEYLIAAAAFIVIFGSFWFFIRSKFTLERWEAAALLLLYLVFVIIEFL